MNNKVNIKVALESPDFKVLNVWGKSGDSLKKHKVNHNALLLVREGLVQYSENDQLITLAEGDCHTIPAEVFHAVTCKSTARFFVVMPKQTTMKFE